MPYDDFLEFVEVWFAGPTRIDLSSAREWALHIGDMDVCQETQGMPRWGCKFIREQASFLGFEELIWRRYLRGGRFFREANLFMGNGFWGDVALKPAEDVMLYDRIFIDFDCEDDWSVACQGAYRLARILKDLYGCDAAIVRSGRKGCHVFTPLKRRIGYDYYQPLHSHVASHVPEGYRGMVDMSPTRFNSLHRIPTSYYNKRGVRRETLFLEPRIKLRNEFTWDRLEPLDPLKIEITVVRIEMPRPRIRVRRGPGTITWIEAIISIGLPDGRKRFILSALNPYCINVRKLDVEACLELARTFLENSCRNYKRCDKIGEGWVRNDLARLARKAERVDEDGEPAVILPKSIGKMDREILDIICRTYREKNPEMFERFCMDRG
ncbi:MAG: DNA primase noncatalytic subunit PriX [Sulfolobales archaeon]